MKILYETKSTAVGGRNAQLKTENENLDLKLSMPKGMGGDGGEGVNPEQLFASAYAACFGESIKSIAEKEGIKLGEDFSVSATIELGKTKEEDLQLRATLDCYLPEVDVETGEDLINRAHEICPYSRATRDNITVTLNMLLDE